MTENKETKLWLFEKLYGRLPQSAEEFTEFCNPPKHKPTLCVGCEVNTAQVGSDICPSCESYRYLFHGKYHDDE